MKAMMMSDLISIKTYLISQTIMAVIIAVFMTLVMGNIYVIMPVIGCIISFSLIFTLIAYDERNGWERFRLTLPLSRTQVLGGRYASALVVSLLGALTGLLVSVACIIVLPALPESVPVNQELMAQIGTIEWQGLILTFAAPIVLSLLLLAVTLPIAAKFGMTKAVRYIPLVFFFVFMGVMLAVQQLGATPPAFIMDFLVWVQQPEGTLIAAAAVLALTLALYAASFFVANKLYAAHEF